MGKKGLDADPSKGWTLAGEERERQAQYRVSNWNPWSPMSWVGADGCQIPCGSVSGSGDGRASGRQEPNCGVVRTKAQDKIPDKGFHRSSLGNTHCHVVLAGAGEGLRPSQGEWTGDRRRHPPQGSVQMMDAVGEMYAERHERCLQTLYTHLASTHTNKNTPNTLESLPMVGWGAME